MTDSSLPVRLSSLSLGIIVALARAIQRGVTLAVACFEDGFLTDSSLLVTWPPLHRAPLRLSLGTLMGGEGPVISGIREGYRRVLEGGLSYLLLALKLVSWGGAWMGSLPVLWCGSRSAVSDLSQV